MLTEANVLTTTRRRHQWIHMAWRKARDRTWGIKWSI